MTRSLISAPAVEVRTHPAGIDLERLERSPHRGSRAARVGERVGERPPLGLPGAERALVLVHESPRRERPEAA